MPSACNVTIVGHLGKDPVKSQAGTTGYIKFSVAVSERRKKQGSDEWTDHTTWMNVTFWGKQAEYVYPYLKKGKLVYVQGTLRLEEYQDRDGRDRQSIEVNATNVLSLSPKEDAATAGAAFAPGGYRSEDDAPPF